MTMRFADRADAGRRLGAALARYRGCDGVVYALPRGGVVLGVEVARALVMPLDLVIPRKIGHPQQPEYAIGAVAESGELACNEDEVARVDADWFAHAVERERQEAQRRRALYTGGRAVPGVRDKTAIIVDDGIATGLTMMAAILDVKRLKPSNVVVAVPVVPADTAARLRRLVDDVVAVQVEEYYLGAVGAYYDAFPQVSDAEVIALMRNVEATRN
jgi:putative phosphoribosyl transferase